MNGFHNKVNMILDNCKMALQSLTWRKNPSIVLFGSWFGEKFADNSRFLFQYLSENKEKHGLTRVVWVSRSQSVVETVRMLGYEAYLMDSNESIYFHKTAKYHIICNSANNYGNIKSDILPEYSWRSVRVNLWHGTIAFKNVSMASREYALNKERHKFIIGLKEFLYQFSFYRKMFELPGGWGDCYYLSSTQLNTNQLIKFFRLPLKNYLEVGIPRVSYDPKKTKHEQEIIDYLKNFDKVIIYLPTFRSGETSFDFQSASRSVSKYFFEKNYLWIQKAHSASNNKEANSTSTNVLNLPHDFDINLLIPFVDLMISDYSSAVGEAMYFYKPIIFYVPDYDEYLNGDRGFITNPDSIMCGPKIKDLNQLQQVISNCFKNKWMPNQKYLEVRSGYYGPDRSPAEIWQGIIDKVNKKNKQIKHQTSIIVNTAISLIISFVFFYILSEPNIWLS